MKLAFLFGAGASKGAGAVLPHPPPLGAELYECLRSAFPRTWGTLHSELDGLFRENFELGMDAAWNQQIEDGAWLLIDMARYFARFDAATDGSDLYSRFTKLLTTSRIVDRAATATLNYECVLEIAASNGGLRIAYLAEEPPPGNLLVWKPHGSCNFLPTSQVFNLTLIAKNFYEGRLRFLSPPEVITLYEQGYPLPPAMSLFAPGKPTPVAPSFVSEV